MAGSCFLGVHSCQVNTLAWSSLDLSVNVKFSFVENDR